MRSGLIRFCSIFVVGICILFIGCVPQNRPDDDLVTVDFADVYAGDRESDSVVLGAGTDDPLQTLMVSPNVVMETSRSSIDEPETQGPDSARSDTPYLKDALGRSVSTRSSTLLLSYLRNQNVNIISPVSSFLACGQSDCGSGTWVERVAQLYGRYVEEEIDEDKVDDDEQPQVMMPSVDVHYQAQDEDLELPTSAFGVRSLGYRMARVRVRIEKDGHDHYRLQRDVGVAESECPDLVLPIAVVEFEGEVLELETAKLMARVFEHFQPDIGSTTRQDIARYRHVPRRIYRRNQSAQWLEEWDDLDAEEKRDVEREIDNWEEVDTLCESIVDEAMEVFTASFEEVRDRERQLVQELIDEAMDPWPW